MADLWQQFHSLPRAIRDGVSTASVIAAVDELERNNPSVDVANVVMRVVTREIPFDQLATKLQAENKIDAPVAAAIAEGLQAHVFGGVVAEYLGLSKSTPATPPPAVPAPPSPNVLLSPSKPARLAPPPPPANLPISPVTPAPPVGLKVSPVAMPVAPLSRPLSIPTPPVTRPILPPSIPPPPAPSLQPARPIGQQAPTTQYSDEDAAEIANQASKLRTLSSVNPNQDLDDTARAILTEQNLAYGDELLEKRAISIIKARLKEIRPTKDTAAMLTRDPKLGGLGLDLEIATQVAAAAERYAKQLQSRGMVRAPTVPAPPVPPPVPSVAVTKPAPLPPFRRAAPSSPAIAVPSMTEAPRPSRPIVRPTDIPAPFRNVSPPAKARPSVPLPPTTSPLVQGVRQADRPTVADIVRPPMILGPTEEFRSMTLIEFRRLGQGAAESARKIFDKLQHLKHESFTMWSQAVAGWRQSDVFQLYLTMGRDSMESGAPISQVIADRGRTGQPYLSEHEFNILADLSRQLQI